MNRVILWMSAIMFCLPVYALDVAGISLPEQVKLDGYEQPLLLNGAGTRRKFVFDIYLAALYLTQNEVDPHRILCLDTPKRLALYFLYDEVSREKLQQGWNDRFRKNNSPAMLALLQERLDLSLGYFQSMKKGDVILIDYVPERGVVIHINHEVKSVIEGFDFMQAVLKVWIGQFPAQDQLKTSLLSR